MSFRKFHCFQAVFGFATDLKFTGLFEDGL